MYPIDLLTGQYTNSYIQINVALILDKFMCLAFIRGQCVWYKFMHEHLFVKLLREQIVSASRL